MNTETIRSASTPVCGESNDLYIRMRSRFDFSGNRTIGEFMLMKATREGYGAKTASARTKRSNHRARRKLSTIAALVLSCFLVVFCTVNLIGAIIPESPSKGASGNERSVYVSTVNDTQAIRIMFPIESTDTTME